MTLHLHTATRLEPLVEALAHLPPLDPVDPFEPETLALQTRGMERWLGQELARHRGVFAHARFVALDDLLAELCAAVLPDAPEAPRGRRDPWHPSRLVWPIAALLREAERPPTHHAQPPDPLSAWLAAHRVPEAPRDVLSDAILQLAWRVAEVFHRYALHRPELVAGWEAGEDLEGHAAWQPRLWRALTARVPLPHPGRRLRALVAALGAAAPGAVPLPLRRLVVFGHHTLAPLHLEALVALGRHLDLHLMRTRVGHAPVARLDEAHPLRRSLGRVGEDLDALIAALAPDATRLDHASPDTPTSLLGRLQAAIHDGAPRSLGRADALGDRSLQLASCSSELRQVEVLRDALLDLFARHPDLEPRDVVIMTPDLETYAPLVDAVFRDGDLDPTSERAAGFPPLHRRHEHALRRGNPLAEAFLAILALSGARLALPAVLDLVAQPPILQKAELDEEALVRIEDLLVQAGVRWGIDERHRAAHGQPRARQNTWAAGFDRLLLGHAMASRGIETYHDVVPVDDVEGKEVETLGRFIDYVERLFAELADLAHPRTVPAWRARLAQLTERLLVSDDTTAGLAQPIYDELADLAERAAAGGFEGRLDLGAVRGLLEPVFEARRPALTTLSGGLTLCGLTPLRTVPFPVVCLLGMDSGRFPRNVRGLGFDLLEADPRPGDRDPRAEDRMTFLETVCAARRHLIITWTGYRATDKRPLDAAGPVAELMEAVRAGLEGASGDERLPPPLLVHHPLQPFTPSNFEISAPLSFDRRYLRGAERLVAPRVDLPPHWRHGPQPASYPRELDLAELVTCLERPAQWFCRQRLGVQLNEYSSPLREREPLALDGLERWELRDRVLGWELDAVDSQDRERVLLASGRLPLGAAGRLELVEIEVGVRQIAERVRRLAQGPTTTSVSVPVDLHLGGLALFGAVDQVHHLAGPRRESRLIRYKAGALKASDTLALWVEHLALAATLRHPVSSHFVGLDGHVWLAPIAPAEARERLFELASLWVDALRAPLPLFPATAWAWFEWRLEGEGDEVPSRVVDAWHKKGQAAMGDATDVHVALLFGHRLSDPDFPLRDPVFTATTELVLAPLWRAYKRESLE